MTRPILLSPNPVFGNHFAKLQLCCDINQLPKSYSKGTHSRSCFWKFPNFLYRKPERSKWKIGAFQYIRIWLPKLYTQRVKALGNPKILSALVFFKHKLTYIDRYTWYINLIRYVQYFQMRNEMSASMKDKNYAWTHIHISSLPDQSDTNL